MSVIVSSVKLPELLHEKLTSRVVEDGYGLRGRSKWIVNSIYSFLNLPQFDQYVEIASDLKNCTCAVSIRMPEDLAHKLSEEVLRIRKALPEIEALKSNIIRASIMQSLIRNSHGRKSV